MILDSDKVDSLIKDNLDSNILDKLINYQKDQGKAIEDIYKLLSDSISNMNVLLNSINDKSNDLNKDNNEYQSNLVKEASNLNSKLEKALISLNTNKVYSDTNIVNVLVDISKSLKKDNTSGITDQLKTLNTKLDSKNKSEYKFQIYRDHLGRISSIDAKTN